MWLRKGSYVTSNSEVQYPSPPGSQGQGVVHPTETEYGGWNSGSSAGTSGAVVGLSTPDAREPEARGPGR